MAVIRRSDGKTSIIRGNNSTAVLRPALGPNAQADRDAAEAARDAAEQALAGAIALGGTQGLALDTDGQPYFDPDLIGTTPTLALGVDTDGVPYVIGA